MWLIPIFFAFVAVGGVLIVLASFVYVIVGAWLVMCLLWAPFAGLLLVRASPDGLDSLSGKAQRFLLGAAMSALFLAPWMYLLRCYKGKHEFNASHARGVYKTLYVIWSAGALQQAVIFSVFGVGAYLLSRQEFNSLDLLLPLVVIPLAALPLQIVTFIASRRHLRRRSEEDWRNATAEHSGSPMIDFRAREYLIPFILVYVWTVYGILHYRFVVFPGLREIDFIAERLPF